MPDRVLDASAADFALTKASERAAELRTRLRTIRCHAPHLIDAELGHVLRKQVRVGEISVPQAIMALRATKSLVRRRYPHAGPLAELAWTWRESLSFYDALYVALAVRLDVPLLTGDRKLANVPGLACEVELI